MAIGLYHYLVLAAALFLTGMIGVLVRRNALIMLMSIELMLSATNIVFAACGNFNSAGRGIYRTTDGGTNWEMLAGGLPPRRLRFRSR